MEPKEQKILTAAYRLFNQHGFRKVTMSDIAEAAEMSRPSLYAAFDNKEAVFNAIGMQHNASCELALAERLPKATNLRARLEVLFAIWIIEPFASVIDSPAGLDLLGNSAAYAPEAVAHTYQRFEHHLATLLKSELTGKRNGMTARDLAHIMMLATKGLKASTSTVTELRRMTNGLIAMAIATAH
ncbi:MAG: helix-turn-helix domain-containing protein [Pseudomonadota bacterium]